MNRAKSDDVEDERGEHRVYILDEIPKMPLILWKNNVVLNVCFG